MVAQLCPLCGRDIMIDTDDGTYFKHGTIPDTPLGKVDRYTMRRKVCPAGDKTSDEVAEIASKKEAESEAKKGPHDPGGAQREAKG